LPPPPDRSLFAIGPVLPAGREILVRAPGAGRVELAGDFTDWRPVELQPAAGGTWRAVLPISSGLHRLAIRIDRGEWHAPPGSRAVRNEFGGEVAEVVVE
jgi:1,4-alpha-glucan branching enzyme